MPMHVFLVAHSILLPDSHTSHAPPPQSLDQALYITGNCKALGDWAVDDVKGPMVLDPNYESPTYRLSVDLPADISIQYKYCIKRNTILSSWETIPPPFRVVSPHLLGATPLSPPPPPQTPPPAIHFPTSEPEPNTSPSSVIGLSPKTTPTISSAPARNYLPPSLNVYGKLPQDHPRRKGGKSTWIDRKVTSDGSGSEIRLTIGANRTTPSLSIRPDKRPSNLGLRLRWGNGDVANNFSASNGNIQARSVRKSVHEAGDTADTRELEHETKILSHEDHQEGTADSGYSTFKFNADLDKIESSCTHEQQWLELEIIDRDMMGVCCAGHISLNQFLDPARSRGSFTVPLFSFYKSANQTPIGEAFIEFLVIHPFYHKNKGLAYSFRNYWTGHREGRTTLDIGHRGAGRSYRSDVMDQADIRENTLLSFSEAGKAGAEYVELDVMLTKDRVPVIFHDFEIGILGNNQKDEKQPLATKISDLTLEQLKTLYTTGTDSDEYKKGQTNNSGMRKPSFKDLKELQEKERLKSHVVNVPTLKELLTELPLCLGLNIEIKYPVGIAVEHMSREPAMEINRYLDDIFDVLFDHVGRRRIVFSCFHPDICTTIKMKQGRFPVALLCGEPPEAMTDYRCCSLTSAVSFAASEYLLGIVCNSKMLMEDDKGEVRSEGEEQLMIGEVAVARAHEKNVVVWTWGDRNTEGWVVALQRKWLVDGVICDNIGKLARLHKGEKGSIFKGEFGEKLVRWEDGGREASSPTRRAKKNRRMSGVQEQQGEGGGGARKATVRTKTVGDVIGWTGIGVAGLLGLGGVLASVHLLRRKR